MISLAGLNVPQQLAASTIEGPVLILAGAGSGKTRTITYRVAHMVLNKNISPKNILAVSFTNKAAREMKERVTGLLGKRKTRSIALLTFHSLGVRILKKEITRLGYQENFSIYDQGDQISIIREALKSYRDDKKFDQKDIQQKISQLKNLGMSAEDFLNSSLFRTEESFDHATQYVYEYYQEKLKFYNAIDFDDILWLTLKLFRNHEDLRTTYSQQFQYIMVDEYQDTNPLQFELILHLTSTHDNLCVVGDDDQSIYAFRGADVKNILEFEKHFPKAKIIKLEENYRSLTPILNLANAVIRENPLRRDKTLWSKKHSHSLPLLWAMGDTDHEAEIVVEEILKHQGKGGHLGDIAILYRSNTQSPPLEDQLRMSQIPYKIIGGQKFYDKKEIKDLIHYLAIILNPRDELSLRRVLNVPHRKIGNRTLEKLQILSQKSLRPIYELLDPTQHLAKDLEEEKLDGKIQSLQNFWSLIEKYKGIFQREPLPTAISLLIEDIKYLEFIEKSYDNPKQVERRKNDVQNFIQSAERFTQYAKELATLKNFVEKLLLLDQEIDDHHEEEDSDVRKNEVTLMTYHSSKGLEFKTVFMVGVEEELLPHKRTIAMGEDISEERRLCYVGITRAEEQLIMTYCKERKIFGKSIPRHPSRFLFPLMDQNLFLHQDRTQFGHLTKDEAESYKKNFFKNLLSNLDDS